MKRFIFIPILALALLSACSTTKVGGRTYNILPLDIEREHFSIVAEDNYLLHTALSQDIAVVSVFGQCSYPSGHYHLIGSDT